MATIIEKDVCNLLCTVPDKLSKIGVQLGIPTHKLDEFKKEDDTLLKTIDYWLRGNVKDVVPVTWKSIVEALQRYTTTLKTFFCTELAMFYFVQHVTCMNSHLVIEQCMLAIIFVGGNPNHSYL